MRKKFVLLMLLAFGVSTTLVAQNESTASGTSSLQKSKKSNFIATISYGLAFRIDGSADDPDPNFNAVVKDLKSGSAIDINLYYLLGNRRTAIGLKYNQFNSNASSSTYSIKDKIVFIGPSVLFTAPEDKKTGEFSLELALGYMGLDENITTSPVGPFKLSGSTFGLSLGTNYHFRINKNILIGPQINILTGSIRKFKLEQNGKTETITLEDNNSEGLTRLDLSVSAKFRF